MLYNQLTTWNREKEGTKRSSVHKSPTRTQSCHCKSGIDLVKLVKFACQICAHKSIRFLHHMLQCAICQMTLAGSSTTGISWLMMMMIVTAKSLCQCSVHWLLVTRHAPIIRFNDHVIRLCTSIFKKHHIFSSHTPTYYHDTCAIICTLQR